MRATLNIAGQDFNVTPNGLDSIKPSWEPQDGESFYRLKPTGSLKFNRDDFARVQMLSTCCTLAVLTLYTCDSDTAPVQRVQINSELIEWDFALCEATVPEVSIIDDYRGVYKYWETKINMLKLPADLTLNHLYQKDATNLDDTEKVYRSVPIDNPRFRTWNAFFFYLVKQTFTGTEYEYLIPTASTYSTLFTATTNPVSNSSNIFLRTAIIQASDACEPGGDQSATGILEKGGNNESMALSLKQVMEAFYVLFDCGWLIDPVTRKFRIEHRLFFDNGYSYTAPVVGIDLRQSRYETQLALYTGNYKNKPGSQFGIEEIILTGNQALNNSSYAFDLSYKKVDEYEFSFGKVDDFVNGNIKYDFDCAGRDEKGALIRDTRSTDVFYTMLDSIQFNDPAIDRTKWFICEYVPPTAYTSVRQSSRGTYTPGTAASSTFAVGLAERVNAASITNANFTATALMRVFHRHGRSFSSGLMNFGEKTANQKGVIRQMYSVKPTKSPQPITVRVNLAIEGFDPYKRIIMPDGSSAILERGGLNLWENTIDLELLTQSSCGGAIIEVPPGGIQEVITTSDSTTAPTVKPKGTKLREQTILVTCMSSSRGNLGQAAGVRVFYADGQGGEYSVDSDPCTPTYTGQTGTYNPNTPSRGPR